MWQIAVMRLIVSVFFVVFAGVEGGAQAVWDAPLQSRGRVVVGKEIWGTDWDSFVVEARILEDGEIYGVLQYLVWRSFVDGRAMCGVVKDLGHDVLGWVEVGGGVESIPEVHESNVKMLSNVGAFYNSDICQIFFECSPLDIGIPWKI